MGAIKNFAGAADGKVTITETEVKETKYTIKELKAKIDDLDALKARITARHEASLEAIAVSKAQLKDFIQKAKDAGLKDE